MNVDITAPIQCDLSFGEAWNTLKELEKRPVVPLNKVPRGLSYDLFLFRASIKDKTGNDHPLVVKQDVFKAWIDKLFYQGLYFQIQFKTHLPEEFKESSTDRGEGISKTDN